MHCCRRLPLRQLGFLVVPDRPIFGADAAGAVFRDTVAVIPYFSVIVIIICRQCRRIARWLALLIIVVESI